MIVRMYGEDDEGPRRPQFSLALEEFTDDYDNSWIPWWQSERRKSTEDKKKKKRYFAITYHTYHLSIWMCLIAYSNALFNCFLYLQEEAKSTYIRQ